LITTCDTLEGRRSTLFLKVANIVKELKFPPLMRDSILITKDQMEAELGILKIVQGTKFNDLANFLENEIRCWLVNFMNENKDQEVIVQQQHAMLKGFKDEL
jgi:hypothetical protein